MDHAHLLAQARICRDQGRFQAAADLLLEAFRKAPADGGISRELGKVLAAGGDLETGLEFLQRAHQADPDDPDTAAELALLLHHLGREEEAGRCMLESLEAGLDPRLVVFQFARERAA